MDRDPPMECRFSEHRSYRRGSWDFSLWCAGDVVRLEIPAIGRDRDAPSDELQEAHVNRACAGIPGVKQVWGPDWEVPPSAVGSVVSALDVSLVSRSFSPGSREVWPELPAWLAGQPLHGDAELQLEGRGGDGPWTLRAVLSGGGGFLVVFAQPPLVRHALDALGFTGASVEEAARPPWIPVPREEVPGLWQRMAGFRPSEWVVAFARMS